MTATRPNGRKLTCCRCPAVKEKPRSAYCNKCEAAKQREHVLKKGRTIRRRDGYGYGTFSLQSIWRKNQGESQ